MQDSFNPYASPTTLEPQPTAGEWLGTPNESLRMVASGLGLFRAAELLMIAGWVLYVAVALFAVLERVGGGVQLLYLFYGAIVVIVQTMHLLASFRCLSTPVQMRARGRILVYILAKLSSLFITLAELVAIRSKTVQAIQHLLGFVAIVAFMLFLRKLGLFIGRTDLARRSINLLMLWTIVIGFSLARVAGLYLPLRLNGIWVAPRFQIEIVGVTYFVAGIVVLVKSVNLLAALKSAILTGR